MKAPTGSIVVAANEYGPLVWDPLHGRSLQALTLGGSSTLEGLRR